MNPEMHRPEPRKVPLYEKPTGIPAGDGWTRTGNYFTKELPNGGVQKLHLQEWEKMNASKDHKEAVGKGLEMQAREKMRQEALASARKALSREFGSLKPGDKDTSH